MLKSSDTQSIIHVVCLCEKEHVSLLKSATSHCQEQFHLKCHDISDLPMYDEVRDAQQNVPKAVSNLIECIRLADSLLFAIPEAHHGLTSSFQNMIDWISKYKVLESKPAAIFGVGESLSQHKTQVVFRYIAASLSLNVMPRPELVIPPSAVDPATGELICDKVQENIAPFFQKFHEWTKLFKATPKQRKIKVGAISGSLRNASANTGLLRAAKQLASDQMEIEIIDISRLPLFSEDIEKEGYPLAVLDFLDKVKSVDALLIASTEYNYGVSGVLKSAIDWGSRKQAFVDKPIMCISSGGLVSGAYGQYHLRQSLIYPGGNLAPGPQFFAATYGGDFNLATGDLLDETTKGKLKQSLDGLYKWTIQLNLPPAVPVKTVTGPIPELVIEKVDKVTPKWKDGKLKILAIAGSLKTASLHKGLTRVAIETAPSSIEIQLADLSKIPFFNCDVEEAGVPQSVQNFVDHVKSADALLIATAEHNYCYSAVLKNAIDWGSRQKAFVGKPAALLSVGASDGGSNSQSLLRQVAVEVQMKVLVKPTLNAFAFAPGIFDFATGSVLDEGIKKKVAEIVCSLEDFAKKIHAPSKSGSVTIAVIPGSANKSTLTGGLLRALNSNTSSNTKFNVIDAFSLPRYTVKNGETPKEINSFIDSIESADAVLCILPEYNNTYSPIIKNALDWAIHSNALDGKPISSVGYGDHHMGNIALYHTRQVAASGCALYYDDNRCQINSADHKLYDVETGDIKDENILRYLSNHVHGLQEWALRVK